MKKKLPKHGLELWTWREERRRIFFLNCSSGHKNLRFGRHWHFLSDIGYLVISSVDDLLDRPSALRASDYNALIVLATQPAPNPLSIFTTLMFEAQLFNMASSAVRPPKLDP